MIIHCKWHLMSTQQSFHVYFSTLSERINVWHLTCFLHFFSSISLLSLFYAPELLSRMTYFVGVNISCAIIYGWLFLTVRKCFDYETTLDSYLVQDWIRFQIKLVVYVQKEKKLSQYPYFLKMSWTYKFRMVI